MTPRWRLLDSEAGAGDWNMALDRALLDSAAARDAVPVLRFYSWEAPTLSFGRMQRTSDDLLRRCAELGVMAVRRPTGGKAILHHHEVTFSIIAPTAGLGLVLRSEPTPPKATKAEASLRGVVSVMESYRTFARAIAAGLRKLGVEAELCEPRRSPCDARLLCFAAPAECDLEVGGKKLLGSAQRRRAAALLQQNSLPLSLSHELKEELFGAGAVEEELRIATDLTTALACPACPEQGRRELAERGREPSLAEVRDAIIAGFQSELGIEFEPSSPTADESAAAEKLRPAFAL